MNPGSNVGGIRPVANVILQKVFARLSQSDERVRPAVYAEIGAIVERICERRFSDERAGDAVPAEAPTILSDLVRVEINGPASQITTLRQSRLIVLKANRKFASDAKQLSDMLAGILKAVGNDLKKQQAQAELLDDIASALQQLDVNQKLIELLEVRLWDDGDVGQHTRSAIEAIAPHVAATTCSWEDLHFWTTLTNYWVSLSYNDDHRANLVRLLELIEALSPGLEGIDYSDIDRLTDGVDRLF